MPIIERKDNIGDTSTTVGTGTLSLAAVAQTGARIFAGNVTSGATIRYDIRTQDGSEWEIGEGVFTDGTPDTLSRVTIYASSNAGALVNFSAGTKNVSMVITAKDIIGEIAPQNLLKNGNFINNSTNGYGSTPDDTVASGTVVQGGFPVISPALIEQWTGVAATDCMGLWDLDGDLLDQSGNGYNLTPSGSAPTDSALGLMAQAKDFESGSSQYANNAAANCRIAGSQTFISFVKPESFAADRRIIAVSDSTPTNYVTLIVQSTGAVQMEVSGLTGNANSDVVLQAGKWYMVVGVYDTVSGKVKIWVNGIKKENTVTGSHTAGTGGLSVGRLGDYSAGSTYFDGLIQGVGVYDVAFTDAQVKALLENTLYAGVKMNGSASLTQSLIPAVPQLRGLGVMEAVEMYQDTASTGQVRIGDGTDTDSATIATTGDWVTPYVAKTISATAQSVTPSLRNSSGNVWFKRSRFYIGSSVLPYAHSADDWSRFPRLLKMDIPAVLSGYQFEELRWIEKTPVISYTGGGGSNLTPTVNAARFFLNGKKCSVYYDLTMNAALSAGTGSIRADLPVMNSVYGSPNVMGTIQDASDGYRNFPGTNNLGAAGYTQFAFCSQDAAGTPPAIAAGDRLWSIFDVEIA